MSDIPNFPGNSNKARAREKTKKVESVVTGEVKQRPKGLGRRFKETFVAGDIHSVSNMVLFDVIIPGLKDIVFSSFHDGLERMMYGDERRRPSSFRPGSRPTNGYVSYGAASRPAVGLTGPNPNTERHISRRSRATHDFGEIILSSRVEAESVIDRLGDLIDQYGVATVSDLYDLVEITSEFTDDKYGWNSPREMSTHRTREGYVLILPDPLPID